MSILDYIERIKRENESPRITAQEPRTMAHGGRIGLQGGQLVQNTADGSRPGYRGPRGGDIETLKELIVESNKGFKFEKIMKKQIN